MSAPEPPPPKPHSRYYRPSLTRLPRLTVWRRAARWALRGLAWLLVRLCTHRRVSGMDNFPRQRPALVVTNHLGDADVVLGLAVFPLPVESLAKIDLFFEYPPLGWLMDAYGVIWLHRGQPDHRALRGALQALDDGRLVGIAPEGRESLSGGLEEGTSGAAYLALKAGVPILPVTYTGSENARIYGNLKLLRRTDVTVTVGLLCRLEEAGSRKAAIQRGTQAIMQALAAQLPDELRGVYR